ncbi:hypothetical protein AtubIFM56815_009505 [Aspergillus tubingensis]|uniref:Uncharacterized protein n=1 Tax=Aspergillus tubingensis TaxID=5068 RepID=A0A9W6AQ85_ASPTU|nr:hypothetical protein AtubIFM56815_009505 [Aspergillus tubingensis]GLB00740.1 hypothetical protein AtubIFM57143_009793 [Aspergillus tubingensis]
MSQIHREYRPIANSELPLEAAVIHPGEQEDPTGSNRDTWRDSGSEVDPGATEPTSGEAGEQEEAQEEHRRKWGRRKPKRVLTSAGEEVQRPTTPTQDSNTSREPYGVDNPMGQPNGVTNRR